MTIQWINSFESTRSGISFGQINAARDMIGWTLVSGINPTVSISTATWGSPGEANGLLGNTWGSLPNITIQRSLEDNAKLVLCGGFKPLIRENLNQDSIISM